MVTPKSSDPGRGLGLSAFLAGFVPGLLQYQLGQTQRAVVAFASCTAVFFAGWLVVGERLFYWALLTPDQGVMRMLASFGLPVTLPELLNLPANVVGALLAFDPSPTGQRIWREPRALEHLGGFLTGASGMLAAFWSAAGHWELRRRRDGGATPAMPIADPALCAAMSWLVPGLGHAKAGQKDKGLLMGGAVLAVFALGLLLSHGHAVDRANYSVWWIAQNLFGGGSLFAALVTGPLEQVQAPLHCDAGVIFCTVAGLMNLVVMIDAFTVAERSVFPVAKPEGVAS
ncbi:MAG: hypothetical protein JNK15_18345 [Planctomycetes bacterium]|nr:hypothetical protein [Planctomycetota bacterium]